MKYVWLIALLLLVLFGFGVAANFVSVVLIGGLILLFVGAVFMSIMELLKGKIWDMIMWALAAWFFGWILSICF